MQQPKSLCFIEEADLSGRFMSPLEEGEKIPVTVYFESYCPDSVKFLTKQLYPTFLTPLGQYMTVSLIPYGKAKTQRAESGDVTFSCHHGEKECRGNKAIACTLKSPSSTFEDQFKFINCTSSIIAANINMEQYPINDDVVVTPSITVWEEAVIHGTHALQPAVTRDKDSEGEEPKDGTELIHPYLTSQKVVLAIHQSQNSTENVTDYPYLTSQKIHPYLTSQKVVLAIHQSQNSTENVTDSSISH
ncbi:hypothetical protein J6590_044672 [Homalodisca vitripennis]|nr:hypothetical protein J6590_044672 [Homalodisca vitripennis]